MTETISRMLDNQIQWSRVASGQLGAYEALMVYAIQALRGQTACTREEVAHYLHGKLDELLKEQSEKLFPHMKNN